MTTGDAWRQPPFFDGVAGDNDMGTSCPWLADSIQRQIDATDKEIGRSVYELYGLTHEEIKIIEESGKS